MYLTINYKKKKAWLFLSIFISVHVCFKDSAVSKATADR